MEININGCRYYYELAGSGEPILFLHGFTADHSTWKATVSSLKTAYQCIAIDIIGHGKSDSPLNVKKYTIEAAATDLLELMLKLGHSSFHLVGYSMGGRLALTMAILFPDKVKSIVLESASPGLKTMKERIGRQQSDLQLAQRIEKEGVTAFVDFWENIALFNTQKKLPLEKRTAIRHQRLQNSAIGLSLSLQGMGTGFQPSWWEELHRLKMPVLLVTGKLDVKFTAISSQMANLLPNSMWREVDNAGHTIHVEDCRKFGTIIREFLSNT